METKEQKTTVRYSISFKQFLVKEFEKGSSINFLRQKYDITGGQTIQNWVKRFGKDHLLNKVVRIETMDERNMLKQLQEENKKLKLALADAYMAKDCLEKLVDLADKEYKTDLKKSFGDRLPSTLKKNTL